MRFDINEEIEIFEIDQDDEDANKEVEVKTEPKNGKYTK